jgi:chromosome segregation ATPase
VRLEEGLGKVSAGVERIDTRVERIDDTAPDRATIEGRFSAVEGQLESLKADLSSIATGVEGSGRDLGTLQGSLDVSLRELRSILQGGIDRWESDRTQTRERLGAIRDGLRDQLHDVAEHVRGASFLGKLVGRGQGSLKLTREEWDRLAGKLESIISGLDAILWK